MKLITNKRRIGKEMLNQGLLDGNPSFSFLYLASSGRPLAGNGRTAPISSISTTVDRSMDLCRPVDTATGLGNKGRKGREMGRDEGEGFCESDGSEWFSLKEAKTKLFIG